MKGQHKGEFGVMQWYPQCDGAGTSNLDMHYSSQTSTPNKKKTTFTVCYFLKRFFFPPKVKANRTPVSTLKVLTWPFLEHSAVSPLLVHGRPGRSSLASLYLRPCRNLIHPIISQLCTLLPSPTHSPTHALLPPTQNKLLICASCKNGPDYPLLSALSLAL